METTALQGLAVRYGQTSLLAVPEIVTKLNLLICVQRHDFPVSFFVPLSTILKLMFVNWKHVSWLYHTFLLSVRTAAERMYRFAVIVIFRTITDALINIYSGDVLQPAPNYSTVCTVLAKHNSSECQRKLFQSQSQQLLKNSYSHNNIN